MEGALDLSSKVSNDRNSVNVSRSPSPITNFPTTSLEQDALENSPTLDTNTSSGSPNPDIANSPTTSRPFKTYPFDPLAGLYSQLATQASALGGAGLYPYASTAGLTPPIAGFANPLAAFPPQHGLLSEAFSMANSPYLQNKKRRIDSRSSSRDSIDMSLDMSQGTSNETSKDPQLHQNEILARNSIMADMLSNRNGTISPDINIQSAQINNKDKDQNSIINNQNEQGSFEQTKSPFPTQQNTNNSVQSTQNKANGDMNYWDRRRKNNEAAKRSRDARRMKEEEIAVRAAVLEQENLKLRAQVAILKNETAKLHFMLYNH